MGKFCFMILILAKIMLLNRAKLYSPYLLFYNK